MKMMNVRVASTHGALATRIHGIVILLLLTSCLTQPSRDNPIDPNGAHYRALHTPFFSPEGGSFEGQTQVVIESFDSNTVIYYTTNGSYPTSASSIYARPIILQKTTTLKAVAIDANGAESGVASNDYHIPFWQPVGPVAFTVAYANLTLAIHADTPFLSFLDGQTTPSRISAMRWNGAQWVAVGPLGFSPGMVGSPSLAFCNGLPHVVFQEYPLNTNATVMGFDGSSWAVLGSPGIAAGTVNSPVIVSDGSVLYVAYTDLANGSKATVLTWNGSAWIPVGLPGFTATSAWFVSLAMNGSTPSIAYRESSLKTTMMTWNGSSWVVVGSTGFSPGGVASTQLVFNQGTPCVAMIQTNGSNATVMKWDGTSWSVLGIPDFTPGVVGSLSMAFYDNTPYVAFRAIYNEGKATLMKFDGAQWVFVGRPGFSAGSATYVSLAFRGKTPYVGYNDNYYGGRATVMKYAP